MTRLPRLKGKEIIRTFNKQALRWFGLAAAMPF